MEYTPNRIKMRIDWCRDQSAQACTEREVDGWRAEEDGLRDALMNRDHTEDYRLCPLEIRERYARGLQDGTALLRAARVERTIRAAGTPGTACRVGQDKQSGDE